MGNIVKVVIIHKKDLKEFKKSQFEEVGYNFKFINKKIKDNLCYIFISLQELNNIEIETIITLDLKLSNKLLDSISIKQEYEDGILLEDWLTIYDPILNRKLLINYANKNLIL